MSSEDAAINNGDFPSASTGLARGSMAPSTPHSCGRGTAQRSGRSVFSSCLTVGGGCLSLLGLSVVIGVIALMAGVLLLGSGTMGVNSARALPEEIVRKGGASSRIALIYLTEEISGAGGGEDEEDMAGWVSTQLRQARTDSEIGGVLLWVDSPGGGLTASDLIYHEVNLLREAGKPVVAFVSGLAASGGYYVIAPANAIFVSPTGLVGSFGVILNRFNLKELMNKVGVTAEPLMSTEMKDIGSPFRDLSIEEKEYLVGITRHFHRRFVEIIAKGRSLESKAVEAMANGKLYTAEESLAMGLIDEIAYFDEALEKVRSLSSLPDAALIRYGSSNPVKQLLGISSFRILLRSVAVDTVKEMRSQATGPLVELKIPAAESGR